jgi:hypothetical protein
VPGESQQEVHGEEDFGGPTADADVPAVEPLEVRFDVEPGREKVRAWLAASLVALLAIVVLSTLGAVIAGTDVGDIKAIIQVLLPPVVALCGSALGFYYASGRGGGSG